MKSNKGIKRTNAHNATIFNSVLWVCSFIILLFLFAGRTKPEKIDYIYTVCFLITLIIPVLVNLYYLIPTFLKREKYLLFLLFFLANMVVFSELNPFFFEWIVQTFFSDYYFISYHNSLEVYFIFFIFFVFTSLIKLTEDWVYLNKVENKVLKLQKQEIEQQLYYLKGQINPHFLFNSLNVLYDLALSKKDEITDAILQLSKILRYVIYDIESNKVPLKKEVSLIKNYIAFEKNRHTKDAIITFNYNIENNKEIYPMLLLPIIENCFKHGVKSGVKNPYININLTEKKETLHFNVVNNFKEINTNGGEAYSGIGIKNIKENLAIVYGKNHSFSIHKKNNIFEVNLLIYLT